MTIPTKPIVYLGIYLLCPMQMNEEEEQAAEQAVIDVFKSKLTEDCARMTLHCNAEDKHAVAIAARLRKAYKGLKTTATQPNFTKNKNRAYIYRNRRVLASCTHAIIFRDRNRNLTQEFIQQEIEDLDNQISLRQFDMAHIVNRKQNKAKDKDNHGQCKESVS